VATPSVICYADRRKAYSLELCRAFAEGCGGQVVTDWTFRPSDVAVIHGCANDQRDVMRAANKAGVDWYQLDHAYLGRGEYHRCSHRALWCNVYQHSAKYDRLERLSVEIAPLPRHNPRGDILLCAQTVHAYEAAGLNYDRWLSDTVRALRSRSSRRVKIRAKPIGEHKNQLPLPYVLAESWACAVHSSASAFEALAMGLPVVVTDLTYPAAMLATPAADIETPRRPSVDAILYLFAIIAGQQWTLDEYRNGTAWEALRGNR
jgi:hypothetical protein